MQKFKTVDEIVSQLKPIKPINADKVFILFVNIIKFSFSVYTYNYSWNMSIKTESYFLCT